MTSQYRKDDDGPDRPRSLGTPYRIWGASGMSPPNTARGRCTPPPGRGYDVIVEVSDVIVELVTS